MKRIAGMMGLAFVAVAVASAAQDKQALPAAGSRAPVFSLASEAGTPVRLEQYRGQWVVLYFYPKDFTSGCTVEAHNFQRDLEQYTKRQAVILGVSVDSVASHKDFCAKEGLRFKLLADVDHAVSSQYGTLRNREGTFYTARTTFLIDPQGVVRRVYERVDPAKHSTEVLAALDSLRAAK